MTRGSECCPELKCSHRADADLARHVSETVNAYFCHDATMLPATGQDEVLTSMRDHTTH